MRYFLFVILGMFLMYVFLKIMSQKTGDSSHTTELFKRLAKTPQAYNLTMTNEFRELTKTVEFREFVKSLGTDALVTVSKTLLA